jgi:hypothetical protein
LELLRAAKRRSLWDIAGRWRFIRWREGLAVRCSAPLNIQPRCLHASMSLTRHTDGDAVTRCEATASRVMTYR